MIKEIYIKGKYEFDVGSAAYVIVGEGVELIRGAKALGEQFTVDGKEYGCDQFSTEILAAICGIARCEEGDSVNIYSNNMSVVKWLARGEEPEGRTALLESYRSRVNGKDVFVDYIPHHTKDTTDNRWNKLCDELAAMHLKE